MFDNVGRIIAAGVSLGIYVLLALGYASLTDGHTNTFWYSLLVLGAFGLLFVIVNAIGTSVAWWLHSKHRIVGEMIEMLRKNSFPMREYATDNFANYLARLEGNTGYPVELRKVVDQIEKSRLMAEEAGMLNGFRYERAWDAAFEEYAPKAQAAKHSPT